VKRVVVKKRIRAGRAKLRTCIAPLRRSKEPSQARDLLREVIEDNLETLRLLARY